MDLYRDEKSSKVPFLILFILGILAGIAFWVGKDAVFKNSASKQSQTSQTTFSLNISSPSENTTTNQSTWTVKGSTGTNSVVTIANGGSTAVVNSNGNFSAPINLSEGKNIITITAFDPDSGQSEQVVRNVLYLNEDLSTL